MWFEIVVRRIIIPILFSVIFFFWGPLSVIVSAFNLRETEGSFVALVAVCCVELCVILAVWEIVVFHSYLKLQSHIEDIGRDAVRKRNVGIAIFSIRLNRNLLLVQRILRQGWIFRGGDRANSVWRGLHSWSVRRFFIVLLKIILSAPVWLSVVCACLMLRSTDSRIDRLFDGILRFLYGHIRAGDLFRDVLAHVPAIVAIMPLISIPLFFYFYGQKRNVRRAIDRHKAVHVEEVALLYERLLNWFDRNLYRLCLNFDYVVSVQRSLVDFQLKHIFPERLSDLQAHRLFMGVDELNRYMFLELDDAQEFSDIVDELLDDRLKRYTRFFSAACDDIWNLYSNDLHRLKSVESVEEVFLCKDAVKSLVRDRISREQMLEPGMDRVSEVRDSLEDWWSWEVYSGLETLYRIKKASRALRRYLYSSRTETLILKVLSREK